MVDANRLQRLQEAKKWRDAAGSRLLRTTFPPKIQSYLNCTAQAAYLRGGNGGGKTYAQAAFAAMALLGRYPPGYTGWRPTPNANDPYTVSVVIMSQSGQVLRDTMQMHILGDIAGGNQGGGFLPGDAVVSVQMARGVAGQCDFAVIRRDDGSMAKLYFRTYEQGRIGLQGIRAHLIVADELFDDEELLGEILGRFSGVTNGIFRLSSTERFQQTAVAQWFYQEPQQRPIFGFSLDDIGWMAPADKKRFFDSLPEAERDTRYFGHAFRGGGDVMRVPLADILEEMDEADFAPFFKHHIAFDFSHFGTSATSSQFCALFMATDPTTKITRIYREIMMRGGPNDHAAAIRAAGGDGIVIAWPHDGQQGQAAGENIAAIYKTAGLRMHHSWATFGPGTDGGYNFESGIGLINAMAASGTLKISKWGCPKLQAQWVAYERDAAGLVVKKNDDAMSALRIGLMMTRIAKPLPEHMGVSSQGRGRSFIADGTLDLGMDD